MKKFRKPRDHKRLIFAKPQTPCLDVPGTLQVTSAVQELVEKQAAFRRTAALNECLCLENAAGHTLPSSPIEVHPPISNRHSGRLETAATHSKQKTASRSNRHFFAPVAH
jgi:hypothetical protein